jgi:hypothetical protein
MGNLPIPPDSPKLVKATKARFVACRKLAESHTLNFSLNHQINAAFARAYSTPATAFASTGTVAWFNPAMLIRLSLTM